MKQTHTDLEEEVFLVVGSRLVDDGELRCSPAPLVAQLDQRRHRVLTCKCNLPSTITATKCWGNKHVCTCQVQRNSYPRGPSAQVGGVPGFSSEFAPPVPTILQNKTNT